MIYKNDNIASTVKVTESEDTLHLGDVNGAAAQWTGGLDAEQTEQGGHDGGKATGGTLRQVLP